MVATLFIEFDASLSLYLRLPFFVLIVIMCTINIVALVILTIPVTGLQITTTIQIPSIYQE